MSFCNCKCVCEEPIINVDFDAACRRCGLPVDFTGEVDGEPADIDSDTGFDPYAGGPEMDEPIDDYDYDDGGW